jgi:hypothetical protein
MNDPSGRRTPCSSTVSADPSSGLDTAGDGVVGVRLGDGAADVGGAGALEADARAFLDQSAGSLL